MEVRSMAPAEADSLPVVHAETWEKTYLGQVPDALALDRIAQARNRDWTSHSELRAQLGGGVLVLVEDGVVVGFCEFGPTEDSDEDPKRVGHIMRIYVLPAYQGRGGGRLLLETACSRLAAGGHESVTLWTPRADTNLAHNFYGGLGWSRETATKDDEVRYRLFLFVTSPNYR